MTNKRIGIIGGSGLYDMEGLEKIHAMKVQTPFGDPSDVIDLYRLEDREIAFLPRHGRGHRILPSELNHRANIWAMKKLGVEWIISVSAVGSFKKELKPTDIVLIDQFFDRTKQSQQSTFFGNGVTGHIMFAHPICEDLSAIIHDAAKKTAPDAVVHRGGTYLNMEGPAFSTRAESLVYKSWGMDVIGMTNVHEAKLAREAEICFATMAMVTDYDCWIEEEPDTIVNVEMIIENLNKNTANAKKIIRQAVLDIPADRVCGCVSALDGSIMTSPDLIPEETKENLDIIIGKYL